MRLMKLTLGAVLAMAVVAAGFAHADVNLAGTTAAGFLSNGTGARVLSMGGATLGLGGDLQSAAWNPAALGWMEHGQMTFAHGGLPGDMQQEWLSGGGRFGHAATRWSLQGLYQGNGSFEGRDASNNPTGTFSASSFAVGAQLAQSLGEHASIGAGAKFVNEKLGDVSGTGVTFDFGGQVRSGPFGFGASAVNVGGQMRYSGAVYDFPSSYGAGVSYTLPATGLSLAVDANFPKSYYNDVRFGAEWRWHETVALRTGYRHELASNNDDGLSGPTFGIGAGMNGFWFDYGYLVSSLSGGSEQRLAISFHLGGFGMAGATAGANGTGASHAPTASTGATASNAPATSTATKPASPVASSTSSTPAASSTPATSSTNSAANTTSTNRPASSSAQAPNARGAAATATAVDDTKPSKTSTGVPPAPASLDRAGPVATVTPSDDASPATTAGAAGAATTSKTKSAPKTTSVPPATSSATAPGTSGAKSATPDAANAKPVESVAAAKPAPAVAAAGKTAALAKPRPSSVKVKSGDTLASIARQYGTSPEAIMMENNMVTGIIKVGQKLKLPQ